MFQNYLKIAFRSIRKYKQFSLINILGLSIALVVAIYMLLYVEDELSYDRMHPNADSKYRVTMQTQFEDKDFHSAWTPAFIGSRLQQDMPEVADYATLYKHFKGYAIKKDGEEMAIEDVYYSSPNFFTFFGFQLKYGNPEKVLSDPKNVVIHERLAQRLFQGESVVGKMIETTAGQRKITGVIADSNKKSHFTPMLVGSIIGAMNIQELLSAVTNDASFYNYITLNSQNDIPKSKIDARAKEYFDEWINSEPSRKNAFGSNDFKLQFQPVKDIHLTSNLEFEMEANGNRLSVIIFSIAAIMILLVASINYMNLASSRYLERSRELGIRKVMGSGKGQLAVQYFTESLVITALAAFLAIVAVQVFLPYINLLAGKTMSLLQLASIENLSYLVLIVVVCAGVSSAYPALYISGLKPVNIFRVTNSESGRGGAFRKGLLVFQIVVTGVLLIFTLVVIGQLQYMQNQSLGFDKEQVIAIEVKARAARSKIPVLKEELLKLSGVQHVALTGQIPGDQGLKTEPMGFESEEGSISEILTNYMFAGPDLANTLGLDVTAGRNFDNTRGSAGRGQEVIVNQSLVDAMNWQSPLDKKVQLPIGEAQVVGVIEDFHLKSLHHRIEPLTIIYLDNWAEALLVKVQSEKIGASLQSIEEVYEATMGTSAMDFTFLDERYARQYQADQQKASLFMLFSLCTVVIAAMGLAGMLGFSLARRSREISIRRVFGASNRKIILLFTREYGYLVLIGLIVSIPLGNYLVKDWLESFPYKPAIALHYFAIPVLIVSLISVSLIVFKTRSVTSQDPAEVLRNE